MGPPVFFFVCEDDDGRRLSSSPWTAKADAGLCSSEWGGPLCV